MAELYPLNPPLGGNGRSVGNDLTYAEARWPVSSVGDPVFCISETALGRNSPQRCSGKQGLLVLWSSCRP